MAAKGKYSQWKPEAVERLRQMARTMSHKEIAAELGRSCCAISSKMYEYGIRGRRTAPKEVRDYMDRYKVRRRTVELITADRLDSMSEDARRLLFNMKPNMRHPRIRMRPAKPLPPVKKSRWATDKERIERMMQLARKVA